MEEKKIVETLFVRRSVNVSEQDIDDILCTAFEGGITYWCDSVRVVGNYLGKYASDQISRGKVSARITGVAELFKKQQLLFIREQD